MKKRLVILTLCVLLALSLAVSASAAEPEGSFVLTVCTANNIVIEPVRVSYTAGQSVKEALLNSGFEFEGLEESNFIYSIEGVVANYVILFDNGNVSFDTPASEVTVIRIGVIDVLSDYCEDMISMIKTMADYNDMENHVQNYQSASTAYNGCLYGIRGDGSEAAALKAELESAISDYEDILSGAKYTVTVNATQYGQQLPSPVITMTDAYGNITTNTGSSIQVIAGDYTFSVSDGGYNRTEGTVKVRANTIISTELPEGEWFGEMIMRSYNWQYGAQPYQSVQDSENHKAIFYVRDTAYGYYGTNLIVFIGDVPDPETTRLRTIYVSVDGIDYSEYTQRSWANSDSTHGNYLNWLVAQGMEGRTFSIEGQYTMNSGYTQIQSYEMEIVRVPSLIDMFLDSNGSLISLGCEFDNGTWDYYITTIEDTINIHTEPFSSDYVITGNGEISIESGSSIHDVVITAPNGMSSTYRLHITKTVEAAVTLDLPAATTATITNDIGSVFVPVNGQYNLVPGETYTCTTTKDEYYHTQTTFIAVDGLTLSMAEPVTEDWLENMAVYSGRGYNENDEYCLLPFPINQTFDPSVHNYSLIASDINEVAYIQASVVNPDAKAYARYTRVNNHGMDNSVLEITYGDINPWSGATACIYFMAEGGFNHILTVRVEANIGGIVYYQDYYLSFTRTLHLQTMDILVNEETPVLTDSDGNIIEFDRDVTDYYFVVDRDEDNISLELSFPALRRSPAEQYIGGYYTLINNVYYPAEIIYREFSLGEINDGLVFDGLVLKNVEIKLDSNLDNEIVSIQVCHEVESAIEITYILHISKSSPVAVTVSVVPEDAVVFMINNSSGKREYKINDVFMLSPGASYSYNATREGYKGLHGSYTVPADGGVLSIALEEALPNTSLVNLSSKWPGLRVDKNNNGVIIDPTPINGEEAVLYWASRLGDGYSSDACSPPILAGGYLYAYSGANLYKIDPYTGETIAKADMAGKSAFAINPPTYANGMIFVGLSYGRIQAFNAVTLESLWIYNDPLSGQPNCSITYHNGYVYTGFWVGETSNANFVCLSATDEDPTNPTEEKLATWTYTSLGGFYWAGAYACDNYLLIGTDDGYSAYSNDARLLSLDPMTGELLSVAILPSAGDIRSTITCYDGKYYFTGKGGYFYEASVNSYGIIQEVRSLYLGGMSTSTPVIYKGRAYVGVSGTGQFTAYSGHKIAVIDVLHWEMAYSASTQGYPQTSGVLTTAYEENAGRVYVYFFDNFTPGKLRILEDKPGQTSASMTSTEYAYSVAYNLFEPVGELGQFALCSPIVDEFGTIYFKNDTGYLMAVGSTIDELEVTQQPDKLEYREGEVFDPTGMKVTAHFANGTSRDVTQYLTWSEEPLTTDDIDFQLLYPIVRYQNKIENGVVQAGYDYPIPMASVQLTIEAKPTVVYGDVNSDGDINMRDANMVRRHYLYQITLTDTEFTAADVNGDGDITMADFNLIVRYYMFKIASFPVENQP